MAQTEKMDGPSLLEAVRKGHKDVIEELLYRKANVNYSDDDGCSPLFVSSKAGNKDIVQILLQHKAGVNQEDKKYPSPLHIACNKNNLSVVRMLLKNKADINRESTARQDKVWPLSHPLFLACVRKTKKLVRTLLEHKANPNVTSTPGFWTPLQQSVEDGQKELVRILLEANADPNYFDCESPLDLAINGDDKHIVELLIKHKANITNQCIEHACRHGTVNSLKILLENRGDRGMDYTLFLFAASEEGNASVAQFMLKEKKADVNQTQQFGRLGKVSPLHVSSLRGHKHVVKMLLEHKANVNQQGIYSALHCAMLNRKRSFIMSLYRLYIKKDIVHLLLSAGADEHLKITGGLLNGKSAADLLEERGLETMIPGETASQRRNQYVSSFCWRSWARALMFAKADCPLQHFFAANPGSCRWIGSIIIKYCSAQ